MYITLNFGYSSLLIANPTEQRIFHPFRSSRLCCKGDNLSEHLTASEGHQWLFHGKAIGTEIAPENI